MLRLLPLFFFMIILISNNNLFPVILTSALKTNESDHLALLAIRSRNVPEGALSSWNESFHFCQWEGVRCGRRHKRVVSLILPSKGLAGFLSPSVGNLSFLRVLRLQNNTLKGLIPTQIGHLFRLERLYLYNNSFEGNVPATLCNCTNLKRLWLGHNKLVGTILQQVTSLLKLEEVVISYNHFRGEIPPSIGNLTSLVTLSAYSNNFGGSIPYAIGQLKKLSRMRIGDNQLNGTIPSSLYNLSLLTDIYIGANQLVGSLPPDIGLKLPKLQVFTIFKNNFTGLLPLSFSNCSEMASFQVGENSFHGKIAIDFGMMPNLYNLLLDNSNFGSGEPDEMNFIASLVNCTKLEVLGFFGNQLRGQLPNCMGNLSTRLSKLGLAENSLSGSIPPSIMNLVGLETLIMNNNQFTGTIPRNLGNLRILKRLSLANNNLSGNIPKSVGNLSLLNELYLRNNSLEGTIPKAFGKCQSLILLSLSSNNLYGSIPRELFDLTSISIALDISRNHLSGSVPLEIGKLHNLRELDLFENKLVGEVPSSIGDCKSLEYLSLKGNFFQGLIPSSFVSLAALQALDLSHNNISGEIPKFLEKFQLIYLNLSFNDFEGEVPMDGVFKNATAISVVGNNRLCGGIPELHLRECNVKERKKGKKMSLLFIILIPVISMMVSLALSSYWLFIWRTRRINMESTGLALGQSFTKYSYGMLQKATNGFSSQNLIGVGSFGRVFKGIFQEDGETVAVKVLNLDLHGASKSFMAECEAWKNIRHRNLVKIITACSSVDFQGNDFKALVYEYMPNGSLEMWLHPTPEYGLGSDMTANGDVYSFGIVLLEMIIGKRPTDSMFQNGLNLHNYARSGLLDSIINIVDPRIMAEDNEAHTPTYAEQKKVECIVSIVKIGIACSVQSAKDRMSISQVVRELQRITNITSQHEIL